MEPETIQKNLVFTKSGTRIVKIKIIKMKNLMYPIIAISLLFFPKISNAQIILEHTFDEVVSWQGSYYFEQALYPVESYYNTSINGNSYVVKIYNTDYSVYSNNTYNFTPPAGYEVNTISMSRELYNTDNNYEFLVNFERTDNTYDNTRAKAILYNQNGSTIKDFGSAYSITVYPFFHIANNHFRLIVFKSYTDGTNTTSKTEIYSVPGTPPTGEVNLKATGHQSPYPNPACSVITLPYQLQQGEMSVMRIYNINGKLIEIKQIDSVFDKLLLNVSNYVKGIYFYEVNGLSNQFVVD